MFAFAFFNKNNKTLLLARDAFGIKPLFYSFEDKEFTFFSEIPALLKMHEKPARANLQRAYDYLIHGDYDSNTETFIQNINQIPPAHFITFDCKSNSISKVERWWRPVINDKKHQISFEDASKNLRKLFLESIKLHLRSDVPVGVALSGGIDSSAIVSTIRHLYPNVEIKTFSYIASEAKISEAKWIEELNDFVNAKSFKIEATNMQIFNELEELIAKQGEPFSSTSIFAQYCVFQLARRKGMVVMLDGQGADELLAGYIGYPGQRLLSIIENEGFLIAHKFAQNWSNYPNRTYILAWLYFWRLFLPDKLYRCLRLLTGRNFKPAWLNLKFLKKHGVKFHEKRYLLSSKFKGIRVKEALQNALNGRGLQSLLRHADRNSMAFSIESRVPFLTIPIAEFLFSLPERYLISEKGTTKHIFREAMRGIMPESHIDRRDKIGFATPENNWLFAGRVELRKWILNTPSVPFLKKEILLFEFDQAVSKKQPLDGKIWRWICYLKWCDIMKIEFM